MATLIELVSGIIIELTALQNSTTPWRDPDSVIPGLIPTGRGDGLLVSRKLDRLITRVSRQLLSGKQVLATSFTDAEWNAQVRNAFGAALVQLDLDNPVEENAQKVLTNVKAAVDQQASTLGKREFAFACTLFSNKDVASFDIGPVLFESRADWLDRKVLEGDISRIMQGRIKRRWQGKRVRKRNAPFHNIIEEHVLDAIGSCPYVCSVRTEGLAPEAAKEKALTSARLALTTVALCWETASKALDGLNLAFDRTVHHQRSLSFVTGTGPLSGMQLSHMPHGPFLKPGQWEEELKENSKYFATAGEILSYILSADGNVARPKLMNTLAQSLLWFHEGCREAVKLMAVVNFSASMDALGSGQKAGGILGILDARLQIKANATIQPDNRTIRSVIDFIYKTGRSRTIHGTNDKLGNDWSVTRAEAEYFARLCLVACMNWAADNQGSNDPLLLMK